MKLFLVETLNPLKVDGPTYVFLVAGRSFNHAACIVAANRFAPVCGADHPITPTMQAEGHDNQ